MRLVTYTLNDATLRLGAQVDDLVVDLATLASRAGVELPLDLLSFIRAGAPAQDAARRLLADGPAAWPAETVHRIDEVSLRAPCAPARSSASD